MGVLVDQMVDVIFILITLELRYPQFIRYSTLCSERGSVRS